MLLCDIYDKYIFSQAGKSHASQEGENMTRLPAAGPAAIWLFAFISTFFPTFSSAGLDAPHNTSKSVGCLSCHDLASSDENHLPALGYTPIPGDLGDTVANNLCWSCHLDINKVSEQYIVPATHSSLISGRTEFGDWSVECNVCHNQHTQEQPGGKFLRQKINLADIEYAGTTAPQSGTKQVYYAGTVDLADGDTTYNGICEVCHTKTTHFRNDGTGSDQNHTNITGAVGSNCTLACHKHENGFVHVPTEGKGCDDCHNSGSHVTHIENPGIRGPAITCSDCHLLDSLPLFKDGQDLAKTTVCDNCHSPGGSFDGVDSTGGSVGAKDNWYSGVYNGNVLTAGKERWCDGCHDDMPANSKADGSGVSARNVLGDNATYGYYQTGHGNEVTLDCLQCHSSRMRHIDHVYTPVLDVIKTTPNPTNYRFYVGKGLLLPYSGLKVPEIATDTPENFKLCLTCHDQNDLWKATGLPADATTNFRTDYASGTGYNNLHSYNAHLSRGGGCIFCHDPHGTSAPAMTVDSRAGGFRFITENTGDGKYYELTDTGLWNSVADNNGGATTDYPPCASCHGNGVDLSAGAVEPTLAMYQRLYKPLTFSVATDTDGDGVLDVNDNCAGTANPGQADSDGDNVGDACDLCNGTFDASNQDRDRDGVGDACDTCPDDPYNDIDSDGVCVGDGFGYPKIGGNDNCPVNYNPLQEDTDGDGFANACDNCPQHANADQADYDLDGIGDVCDYYCDSFVDVWSNQLGGVINTFNYQLALTPDNIYTTGTTRNALPGSTFLGGTTDITLLKYDKNGNFVKAVEFGASNGASEAGESIAVNESDGSIYVTGRTSGSLPGYTFQAAQDLVLAKFDSDLNLLWAKQYGGASYDAGYSITVAGGHLFIGGWWDFKACLIKLDLDGNIIWIHNIIDEMGSITRGIEFDGDSLYTVTDWHDIMVHKFDLDGNEIWSTTVGTASTEQAGDLAVTSDSVYVTGWTKGGAFPGFSNDEGLIHLLVLKFDISTGDHLNTIQLGNKADVYGHDIDTDTTGKKIYVTGQAGYGGEFFAPIANTDYFIIGLDTDFNLVRQKQDAAYSLAGLYAIGIDPTDNSMYLAGESANRKLLLKEEEGCP